MILRDSQAVTLGLTTTMDEEEIYVCPACGHEDHADKFGKYCPACGVDLDELEAEVKAFSDQPEGQ